MVVFVARTSSALHESGEIGAFAALTGEYDESRIRIVVIAVLYRLGIA